MAELLRPKAVIFDWNGTLNDMQVLAAQDIKFAAQFGRELTYENIRKLWGQPAETFFPQLLPGVDTPWQELRRQFRELDDQFPRRLQPHVLPTLGGLAAAGVKMAIVTSGEREIVQGRYMQEAGLPTEQFEFMHFSDEINDARQRGLPDMGAAVEQFAQLGISPHEIVLIGDEPNDFQNAQDAGIEFVGVTNGTKLPSDLVEAGVPSDRMIPDLSRLPNLLGVQID